MRSLLTLLGILGACNRASPDIFHQPAAAQPTPYYDGKMIRILGRLSSGGDMISMNEFWRATCRNLFPAAQTSRSKHAGRGITHRHQLCLWCRQSLSEGFRERSDRRGEKINVDLRGGEVEKQIREVMNQPREVV
jgi:hypothetical protein